MEAFAESSNPGPPRAATYLQHSSSFALQSIYDNVYTHSLHGPPPTLGVKLIISAA